jgi:hypothetical protein
MVLFETLSLAVSSALMLNVIMLSVIMLSVTMLGVVKLIVVAPQYHIAIYF